MKGRERKKDKRENERRKGERENIRERKQCKENEGKYKSERKKRDRNGEEREREKEPHRPEKIFIPGIKQPSLSCTSCFPLFPLLTALFSGISLSHLLAFPPSTLRNPQTDISNFHSKDWCDFLRLLS